ncbi:serine/threonine-protein kinase [Nonomuraea sp. NPDC049152]|uniref:serine/threonine-protein kinase n=1 Tax=Nonomuraea sp. NPDC049152 TaxID=3154350 RepID=UPI0033C6BE8E
MALVERQRFGVYEAVDVLGEGGQGIVYLGRGPDGSPVAIKVLHGQVARDDDARRRFQREAEAALKVAPFCTAKVLNVGVEGGRPYIVSEHVPGPSLDTLIAEQGPRTGGGLQRLAVATLTALAAIHRAGIVHRDFKPSNVIMGPEGPVVIDFGIARTADHTTHSVMGTPAFMAPEQFGGCGLTGAADLFSWAGTMIYAATGRRAFRGDTMPALMHAILTTDPDLSGVPAELRPLLRSCLAKDPATRPTAAALLQTLTGSAPAAQPGTSRLPEGDRLTIVAQPHPQEPAHVSHPAYLRHPRHPPSGPAGPRRVEIGTAGLVSGVLALLAGPPLLYYSGYFVLATRDFATGDHVTMPDPFHVDLPRAVAFAVVACLLCVALSRVSWPAAVLGVAHIPLAVAFTLPSLPLGTRDRFEDSFGFDLMALVSVATLLTALILLATGLLLSRWSRVVAVLAVLSGLLMLVAGVTGLLAELGLAHPRLGAFTTEALGRLMTAVWALATAGLVVVRAVQDRRRSGFHLSH